MTVGEADHPRLTYRPELDGLRGVAVLLVIADHTFVLPAAGRVGVTLFFVLSGYLITSLLLAERGRAGRIDLRSFYVRRVRRLFPALLALVAATGLLVLVLGLDPNYPWHAFAVLGYFANIAYAEGDSMGLYLAHTWSLSLEEQFYLLWPVLVIVAPRRLRAIAIVGIVAAIALRFVTPAGQPSFAPWVRVDAVLAGCMLALVPFRAGGRFAAGGWIALAAVVVAIPDPMTIGLTAATLGSVAVVASATPGWLSWPPLVRVGEISYGLYLWHLAPALLLRGATREHDLVAVALVVSVSFLLALVSERWIERPVRLVPALDRAREVGVVSERTRDPDRSEGVVTVPYAGRQEMIDTGVPG